MHRQKLWYSAAPETTYCSSIRSAPFPRTDPHAWPSFSGSCCFYGYAFITLRCTRALGAAAPQPTGISTGNWLGSNKCVVNMSAYLNILMIYDLKASLAHGQAVTGTLTWKAPQTYIACIASKIPLILWRLFGLQTGKAPARKIIKYNPVAFSSIIPHPKQIFGTFIPGEVTAKLHLHSRSLKCDFHNLVHDKILVVQPVTWPGCRNK